MTGGGRRVLAPLVLTALAAAALAVGAAIGAGPDRSSAPGRTLHAGATAARPSPLAALDARFRALVPAARCTQAAATVTRARHRRAAALKGARTAPPKVLKAKRAAMRGAIALMKSAGAVCAAAAPPAPGTPAPGGGAPGTTTGGTPPTPPPAQVITLNVAPGPTFHYTETSATATAGTFRIELHNASDLRHFAGVRVTDGQPTIAESPLSTSNGGIVSVDVTLAPGTYQIFCRNNGHDQLGMEIPLTVTP